MKNRFVKLTLFLCVIMLIGTSSSAFAASSCGSAKKYEGCASGRGVVKSTSNYMALFGKSKEECMNTLLKAFGLKVKTPAAGNSGSADNSAGNTGNSGNCGANNSAGSNQNCTGSGNQNCTGGSCGSAGNKQDCTGSDCGNNGSNISGGSSNAGTSGNTGSNASVSSYAQQVADLVNEERSEAGLSSLTMNSDLCKVAQAKAEDMRDKNYFSHTSPTYGSPFEMMKQFGISYTAAGENIAKGQRSPESVMTAWMNSQGHRANILNSSYEQIGVGYCTDASGNTYWVQMFIK